jgi:hypothetical protein
MTSRRWMAAAVLVAALMGCGGKVIVDGHAAGEGGAGGQSSSSSSSGQGGSGTTCSNPPNPATLVSCSSAVTSGTGGPPSCELDSCDKTGNTFAAKCQGNTCHCLLNKIEKCTCVLNGSGSFCGGTVDCCPWTAKPH